MRRKVRDLPEQSTWVKGAGSMRSVTYDCVCVITNAAFVIFKNSINLYIQGHIVMIQGTHTLK